MRKKLTGELLAAAGIVASMVYVGLEIRQNNRLAEAVAYQEIGLAVSESWFNAAHNPALNTLVWESTRRGSDPTWWASLDQGEVDVLASIQVGAMRAFETVYTQVELGLLQPSALESMGWSATIEGGPHYLWPQMRTVMDPYFVAFLEEAWGIGP